MSIQLAGCVITDDYDRILLLHRSTPGMSQWELPGGKVEQDESPEAAAIRELDEELGTDVQLTKQLGIGVFEQDGDEYQYAWFRAVVTGVEPSLKETERFDDLDYFDIEDMFGLALSSNMQVLLDQIISGEVALNA